MRGEMKGLAKQLMQLAAQRKPMAKSAHVSNMIETVRHSPAEAEMEADTEADDAIKYYRRLTESTANRTRRTFSHFPHFHAP